MNGAHTGKPAIRQATAALAEFLVVPRARVHTRRGYLLADGVDAIVEIDNCRFAITLKQSGSVSLVAEAAKRARHAAAELGKGTIPLVVVPFMGDAGRQHCDEAGVAWMDLSGNARIVAPGLRIIVEGKPNRFVRRGRPSNAFAPKSARVARWLLMHAHEAVTQRELATATEMDEGFTSRIVARLEADSLVQRQDDGAIRVRDPDVLLDALSEAYDFSKHRVLRGHVAARSGEALLRQLGRELVRGGAPCAVTGLGAAWLYTQFAAFRLVTVYLHSAPNEALLDRLGFRDDPRGANVWLVVPKDEGVFHGVEKRDGISCVHPVQAYLDLQTQPERAKEAAEQLRARFLKWGTHA